MALPIRPELLQQHGFVHGGAVSYLADNALTYAGGSLLGDAVTSEFKINYLRPATAGDRLLAVATALGGGKSQAVCRCDIYVVSGAGANSAPRPKAPFARPAESQLRGSRLGRLQVSSR